MEFVKQIIGNNISSRKCKQHPDLEVEFLILNKSEEVILKCPMCLNENDYNRDQILQLSLIETADCDTIFQYYPVNNQVITNKLRTIIKHNNNKLRDRLKQYFKELRGTINEEINRFEKDIFELIIAQDSLQNNVQSEYNSRSQKESLIKLVTGENIPLETLNEQIQILLKSTNERQKNNSIVLKNNVIRFSKITKQIDAKTEYLDEMKESIKIWFKNFFLVNGNPPQGLTINAYVGVQNQIQKFQKKRGITNFNDVKYDPEEVEEQDEEEKAKKEEAEKQKAIKEAADKEKAIKEAADKEKAIKEAADKEKAIKEAADKEKAIKEAADKEKAIKEAADKEKAVNGEADKEKAIKEAADKEKAIKEAVDKEKVVNDKADKEKAIKEADDKEKVNKEAADKEKAIKEAAEKEKVNKQEVEKMTKEATDNEKEGQEKK